MKTKTINSLFFFTSLYGGKTMIDMIIEAAEIAFSLYLEVLVSFGVLVGGIILLIKIKTNIFNEDKDE